MALAGVVALLTAGILLLARLLRLGFIADFLSRTVLVGFLTGVGFQVGISVLIEMLGVPVDSRRPVVQLWEALRGVPRAHLPTVLLAASVLGFVGRSRSSWSESMWLELTLALRIATCYVRTRSIVSRPVDGYHNREIPATP